MADQKISELTALTGANVADDDAIAIVDTSATETKKIVFSELKNALDTATGFVRITGDTMTGDLALSGADVTFGDNDKAIFGAGSDLQIYHASATNNSVIQETGSGNLLIYASNISMADAGGNEFILMTDTGTGGSVELKHTTSTKLATTSTGIDVTGTVTITKTGTNAAPHIKLTESGDTREFNIFNDGSGNGRLVLADSDDDTPDTEIVLADNGQIQFKTTTIERLKVGSAGDISFYEDTGTTAKFFWDASAESLGIGTTTVNADLHLGAASPHIDIGPSAGNRGKVGFDSSNVYIGSTSGTGEIHFKNNIGSTDAPHSSGDTKMVITDSGVGIGTSSPQGVLDLGSASTGRSLTFAKYNNIFGSYSEGSLNLTSNYYGDASSNAYKTSTTANFGAAGIEISGTGGTSTSGLIQFFVDAAASKTADAAFVPTERMRITSSGSVGIGTSSVTSGFKLDVVGDARFSDVAGDDGVELGWSAGGSVGFVQVYDRGASAFRDLKLNNAVTITSAGNVGIGTSSVTPYQAGNTTLEIDGGANKAELRLTNDTTGASANNANGAMFHQSGNATYLWNLENDILSFGTNNEERMRIDSSGNLLVGKTSSSFSTAGIELQSDAELVVTRNGSTASFNRLSNGNIVDFYASGSTVGSIGTTGGRPYFVADDGSSGGGFRVDSTQFYPVDRTGAVSNGVLNLGLDSGRWKDLYLSGGVISRFSVTSETELESYNNDNASGAKYKISFKQNGTQVGVIEVGTSSTAYNTSSDYRLKENVVDLTGATDRLKKLEPKRFNFIADEDITVDGFLANEVQSVVPEAISGTKDAMRDEEYEVTPAVTEDDGNVTTEAVMGTRSVPDYQGIDQSKLVPLLVATIQELEARITALENA